MNDCLFCKITKGDIPSFKIGEDENFIAILDVFPNCKGQTLIMPKKHYDSDMFEIENKEILKNIVLFADKISNILKEKLQVKRVGMIVEGVAINHLHVKLYPMHGLDANRKESDSKQKQFFITYPGYLTSETGEQADFNELGKLQKTISS